MSDWWALRTVYYGPDQGRLIEDLLLPLALRLQQHPAVFCVLLRPHWLRGPHVDLAIRCSGDAFHGVVRAAVTPEIESWLEQYPSSAPLDAQAYEAQSYQLAALEGQPGPYVPLYCNNTVAAVTYEPALFLGLPELAWLRDEFQCATLELTRRLLSLRSRDRGAFYGAVASMMVCVAELSDMQLTHSQISFRAHAASYLAALPKAEDSFRSMEEKYQTVIDRAIGDALRQIDNPRAPGSNDLTRLSLQILEELFLNIRLVVRHNISSLRLMNEEHALLQADEERGAFTKSLSSPEAMALFNSEQHFSLRVAINFLYSLFPLLSISSAQRFCLAHLVANACERETGVTWRSIFPVPDRRAEVEPQS